MPDQPRKQGPCPLQSRASLLAVVIGVVLAASTASGRAQAQDKEQYWLFNPTPDDRLRSFSTDRPTKSNVPFTVDAGRFQYEMDLVNWSRLAARGWVTTSIVGPNPFLKLGITNNIDFQINTPAYQELTIQDRSTGVRTRFSGFNDMFLRSKINFWGNDGGSSAFAIVPQIKLPTAEKGLGNGAVEGGVLSILSLSLPDSFTLLFNTQVDSLKDSVGGGYHVNTIGLVNLSRPIAKDVTLYGELWTGQNFDPVRTIRQYSFDTAIAWTVKKDLQLDIGANIGLNRDTPALQIYAGIGQRF